MKKHLSAFAAIVAALAGLMTTVSCQKETPKTGETFDMNVTGIMAEYEAESKSELVNSVRASWKGGEKVYVYDGEKCLGALTTTLDGNNDRWAFLSGKDLLTPKAGTTILTLVHGPNLTAAPAIEGGKVSIDLSQQDGTKSTFVIYATLEAKPSYTNEVATFSFATSVLRVNCTGLKENEAITKAEMSNLNTTCVLEMSGTGAPTVTSANGGTITRTGIGSANGQGEAVFQVAFPYEPKVEARVLTITQGSKHYADETFTAAKLNVSVANNTICQMTKVEHIEASDLDPYNGKAL